jgi:Bacterial regulatory proteins, luxR family
MLSLIAQGRSNAAIAGTLFISPKVVEKHVASIFDKLGLPRPTPTTAGSSPPSGTWSLDATADITPRGGGVSEERRPVSP